jgi:hypothetical protein
MKLSFLRLSHLAAIFLQLLAHVIYCSISYSSSDVRLDDLNLRSIIKSTHLTKVSVKVDPSRLESLRDSCKSQLAVELIPKSCFQVIEIEKRLGLLKNNADKRELTWLGRLCMTRASKSTLWLDLESTLDSKEIPDECRKLASKRLSDLRYKEEETAPDQLFLRRFSAHKAYENED